MRSRTRLEVLFSSVVLLSLLSLGACSGDGDPATPDTGPGPAPDTGQVDIGFQPDTGGGDAVSPDAAPVDAAPGDVGPKPDAPPIGPLPTLGNLTMLINLGDSIAAGQGVAKSYADLLMQNDDPAYPAYAGKDFATKYPGLQLADRSVGGATSASLLNQATLAPANPQGNTLVVISIGGNDIINNAMALVDPAQTTQVAQTIVANTEKALAVFDDKARYPGEVFVMAMNVYEMTDGQGTMPADEPVVAICKQLQSLGPIFGSTMVKNFDLFNQTLEAAFAKRGVLLLDVHQAFLGHGFNYKDPKNPHYDAADPTLWLQYDCIHPNAAGHHAIRRLSWQRLFGS